MANAIVLTRGKRARNGPFKTRLPGSWPCSKPLVCVCLWFSSICVIVHCSTCVGQNWLWKFIDFSNVLSKFSACHRREEETEQGEQPNKLEKGSRLEWPSIALSSTEYRVPDELPWKINTVPVTEHTGYASPGKYLEKRVPYRTVAPENYVPFFTTRYRGNSVAMPFLLSPISLTEAPYPRSFVKIRFWRIVGPMIIQNWKTILTHYCYYVVCIIF